MANIISYSFPAADRQSSEGRHGDWGPPAPTCSFCTLVRIPASSPRKMLTSSWKCDRSLQDLVFPDQLSFSCRVMLSCWASLGTNCKSFPQMPSLAGIHTESEEKSLHEFHWSWCQAPKPLGGFCTTPHIPLLLHLAIYITLQSWLGQFYLFLVR